MVAKKSRTTRRTRRIVLNSGSGSGISGMIWTKRFGNLYSRRGRPERVSRGGDGGAGGEGGAGKGLSSNETSCEISGGKMFKVLGDEDEVLAGVGLDAPIRVPYIEDQ